MSSDKKNKVGLWALLAKIGPKIISFLLKTLKLSKVGLAVISFAAYSALFSWKFAILILIAVGFHESGHVFAMKHLGLKTRGWYFLPGLGAVAIAEENYKTYGQNVFIAIMGPIWGMLLAWACAVAYWITHLPMLAAAASWMAVLNIFNLLPVNPLDGGQLIRSIAFSIHKTLGLIFLILSIALSVFIMFEIKVGLFALLLIVGSLELFVEVRNRFKMRKYQRGELSKWMLPASMLTENGAVKHYPDSMNKKQIALSIVSYVGVIAILLVLVFLMKDIPGGDLAANFLE